jgi:prolyl 4-hydroxylase
VLLVCEICCADQGTLEEWYGKGPLKLTSIYGVRKYSNDSILRMHVDTRTTHVVSAIINVDQDVDEPWLLLILDHQDQEHWLEMAPGDMVLYESAKLLHGRPVPMRGRRYENVFIHYKPITGWDYAWAIIYYFVITRINGTMLPLIIE